jgi:Mu-like prophage major head subunit gpT
MSTMNRSLFYKELQLGLNAIFGKSYRRHPELWRQIVQVDTSVMAFEEEVMSVGLGYAPLKFEGATISYDSGADSYVARYQNQTYALAFAITEEAEEDGLYGSLGARYARSLAASMQETKEVNGHALLNNGFSSSFLGGDGVSLFNTAHPLYNGGTLSNTLATQADLAEASLEDAMNQIGLWQDDRGLQINVGLKKLVVPTALRFIARRLLESPYRPGTGDNDINAIKDMDMLPEGVVVTPYLTDTAQWTIITDVDDGLKHFVRVKIQRGMEGDFETGNVRYKSRERYSFGWSDWRGAFSSQGG